MRTSLFFIGFLFILNFCLQGQNDSISLSSGSDNISSASPKAKSISIDFSNPDDVALALKKIHTFKYVESIIIEGEADESSLKKLFYRLSALKNLTSLTLKENALDKIPENISGFKFLQSLTIEGNTGIDYNDLCVYLKTINLNQLNLIDNDLKKTPASISEIVSLRKIQISGSNQLDYSDLVDQLAKLPALNTLSIPVNYLTELPKNITKLKTLQILDVSDNNLTEFPEEISALKAINNLSIQGNLLLNPVKDLEKLKGNNILYLSLDKEISGEELEQIKKMYPAAQIDFPINKEIEEATETKKTDIDKAGSLKPNFNGELKAKKDYTILSAAYLLYPTLFQGLNYNFDTLSFEERYADLRYANIFQITNNGSRRGGTFYFRKWLVNNEKPGKKNETWFRFPTIDLTISQNYPEMRAFSGMYWVYQGDLTKKQFRKKYLIKKIRPDYRGWFGIKKRKRKVPINWNDIRIDFEKNNSLFTIQVKTDTGFSKFTAYPTLVNVPIEKCQQTYIRRYSLYKKSLLKRAQNFKKTQARNKYTYDLNYKRINEYAWKELQLRMSNTEKTMSQEEWLLYYDAIISSEEKAIDNSALSAPFILRALTLRGYNAIVNNTVTPTQAGNTYGTKFFNIDFMGSKDEGKLAVANIYIIDNKTKTIIQGAGTLGLAPNVVALKQFSSIWLLVELRNGNWGWIKSEEIDKQNFVPNTAFPFTTQVFDRNLDVIGSLIKEGIK